ncbi:MAG: hypothetical protein GDA36_00750 [Rhodobacteraceae bacterium]|nr:hypothetical protein [Paracoccaceae bacterium]
MFGGSFDLAILSGLSALGKAVLVAWLCDSRCLRGRFCPIAAIASEGACFGSRGSCHCLSSRHLKRTSDA